MDCRWVCRGGGAASAKPETGRDHAYRRTLLASATSNRRNSPACGVSSTSDFLTLPGLVGAFDDLGYDVVEMVLADRKGWDRYEAAKWLTMRRWLEANPDDDFAAEVRAELNIAPKRYVTYARECFGWGVFALIAR